MSDQETLETIEEVKKPRKPKIDKNVKTIKLKQGFEVKVDRRRVTDVTTFEMMGQFATGENPFILPKLVETALGNVERDIVFAKLREQNDGFVPTDTLSDIMLQVSQAFGPN